MVQWYLLYILKTIWCLNIMIWDYESADPKFDLKINIGHYDIFHRPGIYLISWRLFDACSSYCGSMHQYDQMFDLKINVGHCDLYSMVQWFCLIAWRLFDAWTLLFGIMSRYDSKFYPKINLGHCMTYILWSNGFALNLEDYLMYEHHTLGLRVSMTFRLTSK